MASITKISAADRKLFARAGLAELNNALAKLTPSKRRAFWIAVRGYYEPPPEDQHE